MIDAASELTLIALVTEAFLSPNRDRLLGANLEGCSLIEVIVNPLVNVPDHNMYACNAQIVENVVDKVYSIRFTVSVVTNTRISQYRDVGDRVSGH